MSARSRIAFAHRKAVFRPASRGNPAGRPKGSRNKATLMAEALLDEATGPVVAKAIDDALAGDGPMLRTVFQAICRKDPGRTIELDLPEGSFGDPVAFLEATMRAVALGEITPQEAALLARLASVMVQAQRMKLRIRQLEGKNAERAPSPGPAGRRRRADARPGGPCRRAPGRPGEASTRRSGRTCFPPVFSIACGGRLFLPSFLRPRRPLYRACKIARRGAEEGSVTAVAG